MHYAKMSGTPPQKGEFKKGRHLGGARKGDGTGNAGGNLEFMSKLEVWVSCSVYIFQF